MINRSVLFDSKIDSINSEIADLDSRSLIDRDADEQASILFQALFGNYLKKHKAYILLAKGEANGPPNRSEYFRDMHWAASRVADLRIQKVNTFFAVAPRNRPSRKEKAIPHIVTLHVDVDKDTTAVERRIKREKPSLLVHSGHGFHAYFLLDTPVQATDGELIQKLNKQLAIELRGDLRASNVGRILRVPGTYNLKNPHRPRLVEIVEYEPDICYTLDYLRQRYGAEIENPTLESIGILANKSKAQVRYLGSEERVYVDKLLQYGLFEPSSRNTATLILSRYCLERGMSPDEASGWITKFFERQHNNLSKDWLANPDACIKHIRACVAHCWKKAPEWQQSYRRRSRNKNARNLSLRDTEYIESLPLRESDKKFLADALKFILNEKQGDIIFLSTRQIKQFRGVNWKNYKDKLSLLELSGIIKQIRNYRKLPRLAREFKVLYQFQENSLDDAVEGYKTVNDRIDDMIRAGSSNRQIREEIPKASKQSISYRRKRLKKLSANGWPSTEHNPVIQPQREQTNISPFCMPPGLLRGKLAEVRV